MGYRVARVARRARRRPRRRCGGCGGSGGSGGPPTRAGTLRPRRLRRDLAVLPRRPRRPPRFSSRDRAPGRLARGGHRRATLDAAVARVGHGRQRNRPERATVRHRRDHGRGHALGGRVRAPGGRRGRRVRDGLRSHDRPDPPRASSADVSFRVNPITGNLVMIDTAINPADQTDRGHRLRPQHAGPWQHHAVRDQRADGAAADDRRDRRRPHQPQPRGAQNPLPLGVSIDASGTAAFDILGVEPGLRDLRRRSVARIRHGSLLDQPDHGRRHAGRHARRGPAAAGAGHGDPLSPRAIRCGCGPRGCDVAWISGRRAAPAATMQGGEPCGSWVARFAPAS